MSGRKKLVLGIPVDVNEATAEELALVPGIGEGLARRIAEFRASRSAFKTWHDLRKVKGVGPANIRAFRDFLQIGLGENLGPSGPKACLSSDPKK
jgi:competence protein ComEA